MRTKRKLGALSIRQVSWVRVAGERQRRLSLRQVLQGVRHLRWKLRRSEAYAANVIHTRLWDAISHTIEMVEASPGTPPCLMLTFESREDCRRALMNVGVSTSRGGKLATCYPHLRFVRRQEDTTLWITLTPRLSLSTGRASKRIARARATGGSSTTTDQRPSAGPSVGLNLSH